MGEEKTRSSGCCPASCGTAVRPATADDVPSVLAIVNWAVAHTASIFRDEPETPEYWLEQWRDTHETHPWFVAEAGGEVVGFARAHPFRSRCGCAFTTEVSVYVAPGFQGRGVGRALYRRLIPTLAAQGYRTAVAEIAVPNVLSDRLHGAFGFEKTGHLSRVGWKFETWHDVAFWQLELGGGDGPPDRIKAVSEGLALAGRADAGKDGEEGHRKIREIVSRVYASVLSAPSAAASPHPEQKGIAVKLAGYSRDDLKTLPADAVVNSFGCGNPLAFSGVAEGETVLDLGSGAGIDLLLAARIVGPAGHVIGVDMTDEMLARASKVIAESGRKNVEVRKGLIEDLPVDSGSVDWVISNCVINLSPQKEKVFAEIARVLKPGGRMLVSDIVVQDLPERARNDLGLYCSCVAGAISEQEYGAGLRAAGLEDVEIRERIEYDAEQLRGLLGAGTEINGEKPSCCGGDAVRGDSFQELAEKCGGKVWSAKIFARKPSA